MEAEPEVVGTAQAAVGARVIGDARVVDDGQIVTAGGVTAGLDLSLWLVGGRCQTSKRLLVSWQRRAGPCPVHRHLAAERSDDDGQLPFALDPDRLDGAGRVNGRPPRRAIRC